MSFSTSRCFAVAFLCLCFGIMGLSGVSRSQHALNITVEPSGSVIMGEWETENIVVTATDTEPSHIITFLPAVDLPSFASGWDERSGTSPVVDTVVLFPDYCESSALPFIFWFEAECNGGLHEASDPIFLTVQNVNRLPESPAIPGYITVLEHETVDFPVYTSDADRDECGDTLLLEVVNPPAGSNFIDYGDGTGFFNWPDATPGGVYDVHFRAIDEHDTTLTDLPTHITVAADTLDLVILECVAGDAGQNTVVSRVYLRHAIHELGGIEVRASLSPIDLAKFTEATFSSILPETYWQQSVNIFGDSNYIEILALVDTTAAQLPPADTAQLLFEIWAKLEPMTRDSTGQPVPMPDTSALIQVLNPEISWIDAQMHTHGRYPPPVSCNLFISEFVGGMFVRSDVQADGDKDLFDAIYLLNWLGGINPQPQCVQAADVQNDNDTDLFDAIYLLNWLGGINPPPQAPCCDIPGDCGPDPDAGPLSCNSYPPCGAKVADKTAVVGDATASRLVVQDGQVILANAEPILGFAFTVEYDGAVAKVVDNAGLISEDFDFFIGNTDEPGVIRVVALRDLDMSDGVELLPAGEHEIARLSFDREASLRIVNSVMAIDAERALNHQVVVKSALPTAFRLDQNYPNPFNPSTTIHYLLPSQGSDARVTLEIYDLLGQLVRTLVDGPRAPGSHRVVWNGRDEMGQDVASGIYFYRLRAGDWMETRRMVLLK